MPKIVKTGAGWFNLNRLIMAEYVESAPGKRKLRVSMDEGQTRDLDEPDAARLEPRLDALDTKLTEELGLSDEPPEIKRAGKFKDRKAGNKGAGGGEESGPESPPPTRAPRPR